MPEIAFGGDGEGGLQGPAATWAVPAARPEAPEDAQVGSPQLLYTVSAHAQQDGVMLRSEFAPDLPPRICVWGRSLQECTAT